MTASAIIVVAVVVAAEVAGGEGRETADHRKLHFGRVVVVVAVRI
jgi:hypothetical protein